MNQASIKSFINIVEEKSISRAAQRLHMSQSALSQQIKQMEEELDTLLLLRSNQGVSLTKSGELFYNYAQIFEDLYSKLQEEMRLLQHEAISVIKVTSSTSICEYLVPCALNIYQRKNPSVRFNNTCNYTQNVLEEIQSFRADIGFISQERVDEGDLICRKMTDNALVIISSPQNTEIEKIKSLRDLSQLNLLLGPRQSGLRQTIERAFSDGGIPPEDLNIAMELGSIEALKASVINDDGISIVPYVTIKKEIYLNLLKQHSIPGIDLKCPVSIVYHGASLQKPELYTFIDFMLHRGKESFC